MDTTVREPYAVGYRKPPKEHRFKPGYRANPRGRGKAPARNLAVIFADLMHEYVALTDGARNVCKQEAFVRSIIRDALQCQPRAFRTFVNLARRAKLLERPRDPSLDGGVVYVDTMTAAGLAALRAEMAAAKQASNGPIGSQENRKPTSDSSS